MHPSSPASRDPEPRTEAALPDPPATSPATGSLWSRVRSRLRRRRRVHLLHIGKTGGTAVKAALSNHLSCRNHVVVLHDHHVTLRDVPERDLFMFLVRDPVDRFVSAFHSRRRQGRRRQGRPRYSYPWSDAERVAFGRFETPNDLALALEADDESTRRAAEAAMRSIHHVQTSYWDWFESEACLRSRVDGLFFIGHLETLAADFEILRSRLGLADSVALPDDAVAAHRAPDSLDRHLGDDARDVLARWHAREYEFLELCRDLCTRADPAGGLGT